MLSCPQPSHTRAGSVALCTPGTGTTKPVVSPGLATLQPPWLADQGIKLGSHHRATSALFPVQDW